MGDVLFTGGLVTMGVALFAGAITLLPYGPDYEGDLPWMRINCATAVLEQLTASHAA
jgi:hypothetical protein